MKVFLNPGHDRSLDSGAVNPISGLREADVVWNVTVEIPNSIKSILENAGIEVEVLQSDSLSEITNSANWSNCDYFVSIHCNAFNTVAKGTEVEVYGFNTYGAELGQSIQNAIVSKLGTVDRGIKERPNLYVLKYTDMPACLVELAFIDNYEDEQLLQNNLSDFAYAVAKGILDYIGMDIPDSTNATSEIAPNGKPYEANDIQYLLNQGYTRVAAIAFLAESDKYSNSSIDAAARWADSRVGTTGYGNNGCTAFVRDFLLQANHWFGSLMADGSQGNLMWVPNIMAYAKANNMWKEPSQGGVKGDICLLETNYCKSDGPDHVVIADGTGSYWGNSSSRNLIVKSNIAYDYGSENIWGYVSTGTGTSGKVVFGSAQRASKDIIADAGSTSYGYLAPNGKIYEENDIKYLTNNGYTLEDAIDTLSKTYKYTTTERIAPNGKPYEQNDIDYLLNQGYTLDAAINFLSTADKYMK